MVHIQLGCELGAGGIEGSAGVDGVEIWEGTGVVVAGREECAGVAHTEVEGGLAVFNPLRKAQGIGDVAGSAIGGEFQLDLFFDRVLHRLWNVGDADVIWRGGREVGTCGGGCGDNLHGGGLSNGDHIGLALGADGLGFSFSLADHFVGFLLGKDAAFHEFLDEVDGDISRGCGGSRRKWGFDNGKWRGVRLGFLDGRFDRLELGGRSWSRLRSGGRTFRSRRQCSGCWRRRRLWSRRGLGFRRCGGCYIHRP